MISAQLTLDPAFTVGPVRRRTFGSFVEHLGRCVYTGLYEPEHPSANDDGFRMDVVELVGELRLHEPSHRELIVRRLGDVEVGVSPDPRPPVHPARVHGTHGAGVWRSMAPGVAGTVSE